MPANIGSQQVTLLYHKRADSSAINKRFVDIRKTGIYSGGYLTVVSSVLKTARLSTLVCEISDGTHQVKISTGDTVTITVTSASPYIVLRWIYSGSETNDYMAILAVISPSANDLVVGKCSFTDGGNLQGFDYTERSTPNIIDLFLKVEPTEETELRVRIRSGRIQNGKETIQISDQITTGLFVPPTSNSKIYLVYVNRATGAIAIDSSGVAAVSPVAPNYAGRVVLAEVTLAAGATNVVVGNIVDVRDFTNISYDVDNSTIVVNVSGKLAVNSVLGVRVNRSAGITYFAETDGVVEAWRLNNPVAPLIGYYGTTTPPTNEGQESYLPGSGYENITMHVRKGEYWRVEGLNATVRWIPIGN